MLPRRVVATLLAGLAYVLGSYWLMTRPASPWNVVGVLAPMLAAIGLAAWRGGRRALALLAGLAVAALLGQALRGATLSPGLLYLAQHVGTHLFLGAAFGSTLRAGAVPLITQLARPLHRDFTPAMVVYTRHVTIAWVAYFISMAVLSVLLYATLSLSGWAVYANLLTPLAIAAMFAGEYLLRYRLHPEFERSSIADAIRSYLRSSAA